MLPLAAHQCPTCSCPATPWDSLALLAMGMGFPCGAGWAGCAQAGYTHHAKSTQAYMIAAPSTATVVSSVCSSSCWTAGKHTVRFCPL